MYYSEQELTDFFNKLDRRNFIETEKEKASLDQPVPIGHQQTISQPSLVLKMTTVLDLYPEARVLEIGTGSGYQTAFLAAFSKEVYTVERIKPLQIKAKERLKRELFSNIHFRLGDGSDGWPEHQPYDRIMVTASVSKIPEKLMEQLAPKGKMLIPIGNRMLQELQLIEKNQNGNTWATHVDNVAFVRLQGNYS